jgi:polysaccharide pyruvyl transferase WcaK-like protein
MTTPSILISNTEDQRLDIIRRFGQIDAICDIKDLEADQLFDKIKKTWNQRDSIKEILLIQTNDAKINATKNTELLQKIILQKKK